MSVLNYSILHKRCPYSHLFWSAFNPHFPTLGLNKFRIRENAGKMRTRTTPNTDTFYAVPKKDESLENKLETPRLK